MINAITSARVMAFIVLNLFELACIRLSFHHHICTFV
jgi:hypothetical protein